MKRPGRAGVAILVVLAIVAVAPLREAHAGTGTRLARWLARPLVRALVSDLRRRVLTDSASSRAAPVPAVFLLRKPPW